MIIERQKTVTFDPADKKHRDAFHKFLKRRAWVDSPLRFTYDPAYGSVVDQVSEKLVTWYLEKEMKSKK